MECTGTRRVCRIICTVAALTLALALTACGDDEGSSEQAAQTDGGGELQKVKLLTGFGIQAGTATGEVVAREKGFYEDAGLDVEIQGGQGSSVNVRLIAEQQADFAQVDASNVAQAAAQGAEVRMVAAYRQDPGNGVLAQPDIETIEDMSGKTWGAINGDFTNRLFPTFARLNGVEGVKNRSITDESELMLFREGRIDMSSGLAWSDLPAYEVEDIPANFFPFSDYGIQLLGLGYVTHQDVLDQDADMVKRFVEASLKGHQYAWEHPDEAVELLVKANSEVNPDVARAQIETYRDFAHTEATEGKNFGWMSPDDWTATVDLLVDIGDLKESIDPTTLYENVLPESADG